MINEAISDEEKAELISKYVKGPIHHLVSGAKSVASDISNGGRHLAAHISKGMHSTAHDVKDYAQSVADNKQNPINQLINGAKITASDIKDYTQSVVDNKQNPIHHLVKNIGGPFIQHPTPVLNSNVDNSLIQ